MLKAKPQMIWHAGFIIATWHNLLEGQVSQGVAKSIQGRRGCQIHVPDVLFLMPTNQAAINRTIKQPINLCLDFPFARTLLQCLSHLNRCQGRIHEGGEIRQVKPNQSETSQRSYETQCPIVKRFRRNCLDERKIATSDGAETADDKHELPREPEQQSESAAQQAGDEQSENDDEQASEENDDALY